ncbi:MAG: DNA phosphorothioation system sulfurtransferase DndC [Terrimicrobiaceae bacterium]
MISIETTDNKSTQRTVSELIHDIQNLTSEIQELYCLDDIPWICGYSGGKDSTTIVQLIWNAIAKLPPKKRTKPIHIISTDTLVENPVVAAWVRASLERIEIAAKQQKLPFQSHLLHPEIKDTFWVNLIGKGYPAPRNKFRWCTERLKIFPSNRFVRDVVRANGETILVLGTRKAESQKRAATMLKHQQGRVRDRLSPNASLPNSLIYSPIEDWRNDEVWLYLTQYENPWGHSNSDLFRMYRGATADNECPLVVDTSTPSCGSSRFGCWVCTMVERDKSMEAMIQNDDEKEWMQPLLDLRDELDFRSDEKLERDHQNRDFRRLRGNVQLFERGESGQKEIVPIPGPYKKQWREHLLRQLLKAQTEVRRNAPPNMENISLISLDELSEIRRIWLEDKHEFDDALPQIYLEEIGEIFRDPRIGAGNSYLGTDEWELLEELCQDDPMHFELVTKLLDTERQYRMMARRIGIYDGLEKCFRTSSRSENEAISRALYERKVKQSASQGDVQEVIKELTEENSKQNPFAARFGITKSAGIPS